MKSRWWLGEKGAQLGRQPIRTSVAHTWRFGGRRGFGHGLPWNDLPFKEKAQPRRVASFTSDPPPRLPMSVNQRGRIVGQVVHPGVTASERKQKRLPSARPHTPVPPQDVIEISSDEDEELQPPPKKTLAKRRHPPSTHEPDYKARLSQKEHEIEKLKKVRHQ